jgi:zinc/manganese transport system substrate-binding protein
MTILTDRRTMLAGLASALAAPAIAQARRLKVVASFTILADFAREVGGERVEARSLVGPDIDAHVFRPTPQDARVVKDADVVIVNGLGFDGFAGRLVGSSGGKARVVTATNGISLLDAPKSGSGHGHSHGHSHSHGKHDPHAWQSIDAAKIMAANIRDGLIAADAAGADDYRANAERYLGDLDKLKDEIRAILAAVPRDGRLAIVHHDSFRYLSRDFGIRIEAARGLSTEAEPSARDIARIVKAAKDSKAKAVFVESVADPRVGAALAREAGARLGGVLHADALTGPDGPAPTYIAMMRRNARTLAEALKD